jgi:preprotein translocase subunit SecA
MICLSKGPALTATPSSLESPPPARQPEIGRNDPCPCGSGKKYKKC